MTQTTQLGGELFGHRLREVPAARAYATGRGESRRHLAHYISNMDHRLKVPSLTTILPARLVPLLQSEGSRRSLRQDGTAALMPE